MARASPHPGCARHSPLIEALLNAHDIPEDPKPPLLKSDIHTAQAEAAAGGGQAASKNK